MAWTTGILKSTRTCFLVVGLLPRIPKWVRDLWICRLGCLKQRETLRSLKRSLLRAGTLLSCVLNQHLCSNHGRLHLKVLGTDEFPGWPRDRMFDLWSTVGVKLGRHPAVRCQQRALQKEASAIFKGPTVPTSLV
jgi:hypothetical protein